MRTYLAFIKTGILMAALTALFIGVGTLIAGRSGATIFFIISLVMNLGAYWFSDKIALSMAHAQPIDESQAPQTYADIRELTQKMSLPMPQIYVSPEAQPNAFATGRNPGHAAVCVTQGLLQALDRQEVRAVLAHELGHVKNHDILITTIAAVVAGAISSLANLAFFIPSSNDNDRNPVGSLIAIIVAPIAATLIQLAISRSREYAADATGAQYSGSPRDLAEALVKIEDISAQVPMNVSPSMATLYIGNPLHVEGIAALFSTHPKTADRVAKLLEMEAGR